MPLDRIITVNASTQVFIWKIAEDFDSLIQGIELLETTRQRLLGMKSVSHQCGFLSIRHLLKAAGYSDSDLQYDENGKPHLVDGKHISITHSFTYAALIISDHNVGIDIEMMREKIIRIADKFTNEQEQMFAVANPIGEKVKQLTVIWGAKEAMYKMCNSRSLSFKSHMHVFPFNLDAQEGHCQVISDEFSHDFTFYFLVIENFVLVYTSL
ncbi:4'-phosphopantetheinyl transferase superfamily protein [Flavobacterium sp. NKUCC04_CG]|uniref:4'-phosphopantetheinyl transferase superfamily protein n=1 Tax=Flavobacterium sp. NKUCC04_CG TaxID=2842121 RepID=UPI001C5ACE81|nr:4'-phosphopantetheinyl transferase superfamily protein [Flavobacterium sp. NKUCC04_CG]MBW3517848.1 4'-phosphopantetheinyl transferase superfamily protein [Flavobacterium sp. NKUCC04_CG]